MAGETSAARFWCLPSFAVFAGLGVRLEVGSCLATAVVAVAVRAAAARDRARAERYKGRSPSVGRGNACREAARPGGCGSWGVRAAGVEPPSVEALLRPSTRSGERQMPLSREARGGQGM